MMRYLKDFVGVSVPDCLAKRGRTDDGHKYWTCVKGRGTLTDGVGAKGFERKWVI